MRSRLKAGVLCAATGLALAAAERPAAAQPLAAPPPAGVISYDASHFAGSRPESAYDMVLLVPGFAFDAGQELRGFASAAGNVLIDGHRPSTKSDALGDILKRISASGVARLDVIRGGAPGIDMQGHTVLVNVIRKSTRDLVSTSDALLTRDGRLGVTTRLDFERRSGAEGAVVSLYLFDHQGPAAGDGRENRTTPQGQAISAAEVRIANPNSGVRLSGEFDTQRLGGLLRLKSSALYGTNLDAEEDRFRDAPGLRNDLFVSSFRDFSSELSADYARRLTARAELSLIAIETLDKTVGGSNARQAGAITNFGDEGLNSETILRATLTYTGDPHWSLQVGGEEAYNHFDGKSHLIVAGAPQVLPSSDVLVTESRAEAFAILTWRATPKLTIEAGSRFETSRLVVSGDAHNVADFNFPKPRLVMTWTPSEREQFRARLERVVGQLDFGDFVTSSSLEQGVTTGGNPQLEPERDWIAELAWDRRFGKTADVVVTVSHADLEKVVDQLPLNGLSTPGNIGDGVRDQAAVDLTLPLNALGLAGGLFKAHAGWTHSSVVDPTTRARRMITNDQPFVGTATITGDVPSLRSSWQIDLSSAVRSTVFRIDEIDEFRTGARASALWEWKPRADLAVQAQLQGIGGADQARERVIFSGLRNTAGIAAREQRDVRTGPRLYLRIRKSL